MTPRSQERLFDRSYAVELIKIAKSDYLAAVALMKARGVRIENAFFMAQQSIEKSIKAVLVANGLSVPLVHELGALISKLPENLQPPYGYELIELNQYASVRRYEEGKFIPSPKELKEVIYKTKQLLDWASNIVKQAK